MEVLVVAFVFGLFIWILQPVKRRPPRAGDQLIRGLKAAYDEIKGTGGGGGGAPKGKDSTSPYTAMVIAVVLGLLLTYVL